MSRETTMVTCLYGNRCGTERCWHKPPHKFQAEECGDNYCVRLDNFNHSPHTCYPGKERRNHEQA